MGGSDIWYVWYKYSICHRKQLKAAVTAESEPLFCPQFSQGGLGLGTGTAERDFLRFSM